KKDIQLQVALAFSIPVFITPPGAKRELGCSTQRTAASALSIVCENRGAAYAQPREFSLLSSSGEKVASRDSGGYILPGVKRAFDLKRADAPIPGGKYKLAVGLDDGTAQTYDVTVSE